MRVRVAASVGLASLLFVAACGGEGEAVVPEEETDDTIKRPAPVGDGDDGGAGSSLRMPEEVWLTDLPYVVVANGHGPAEKDMSNGDVAAGDGAVLSVGGTTYERGLGVHSLSEITLDLGGRYQRFVSDVGIDDEVPPGTGGVVFQVFVDGNPVFESGLMARGPVQTVNVPVAGARALRLVVTDGANGPEYDHADWAGARLVK